jgi:DNA repair protein SbcC/Rad50
MIPLHLTLKNFLSYQAATLNFQGLHTACICGANGAGKSSLLEAIAWVVWGESRANSEDDVIHMGSTEARVDFIFTTHDHTYRIIRTRQRRIGITLEFQVARKERQKAEDRGQKAEAVEEIENPTLNLESRIQDPDSQPQTSNLKPQTSYPAAFNFRSLTAKGVRATQQLILEHIKLDYDTFVNSAYLRQGRADEFMLKRPTERKQILADLLKLNQYDELAERAKDQARQLKGQLDLLQRNQETIQQQLQQSDAIAQEQRAIAAQLADLQQQQTADETHLQTLQASQQQRQTWQQEITWQQQQQRTLEQDCQRMQQELTSIQQQQQELSAVLQQEQAIIAGYSQLQMLQIQEEQLSQRFKTYQQLQEQRQTTHHQSAEKTTHLKANLQLLETQLAALQHQEQDIQQILQKAPAIADALKDLHKARTQLSQLDQLQLQASPLMQRRQHLQTQLDRHYARLAARLDELRNSAQNLQTQQASQPHLHQAVVEVSDRIESLEQRRSYQQEVREKGLERRSFMERLQADQCTHEAQLANIDQKIHLLKQGIPPEPSAASSPEYPPCPLCDRPLDEQHWQLVLEKHQAEQQAILDQLWVIREQLSTSEREIQILRKEYRTLDKELNQYAVVLEKRGQLQAQLQVSVGLQSTLQTILVETTQLEQSIETKTYAADLHEELRLIETRLQHLNYDERNHALARGDVDRWRWAEIKQSEMNQAQRQQVQISEQMPKLHAEMTELQIQLNQQTLESKAQIAQVEQQIVRLGYDLDQHNSLRGVLRQAQSWQLRYQALCQARQQLPQIELRLAELLTALGDRQQALATVQAQLAQCLQKLQQTPDVQQPIAAIVRRLHQRRSELDEHLSTLGRLQQQQQQLDALTQQQQSLTQDLHTAQLQLRVYQELAQAFGKNGIQALMIENALPHLEAETNRILTRLSANQLHVQFVTQRASTQSKLKTKITKLTETLDILIADAQGTRPYETYSGGEAFRVNFAIRLALAKWLAQRSGNALQLLIVDEGFGTQDAEGCDRLIAAINAIASDFACILTITHVPHFKEAFQSRIEVSKTAQGSQLQLVM